jgi:protein-serine/threonine kinase
VKRLIGKGAFGSVCLVQKTDSRGVYAMKMVKKASVSGSTLERDILVRVSKSSPWVANLFFTFQDSVHLYYVMEFLLGGDFLTLLINYRVLSEDMTRFYIAEILSAVDSIHQIGLVHRWVLLH